MNIGVDIDGVLADSLSTWVAEMNRYFCKEKKLHDCVVYQFEKIYDVTWEEMDFFFRTYQDRLLSGLECLPEASIYMKKLNSLHNIYLITARPEEFRDLTESWLKEKDIPYKSLIMTDYQDKTPFCKALNLDLFIEDSLQNALTVSKLEIPVLLFDAPYNQSILPDNVIRVFNWSQIFTIIEGKETLRG